MLSLRSFDDDEIDSMADYLSRLNGPIADRPKTDASVVAITAAARCEDYRRPDQQP